MNTLRLVFAFGVIFGHAYPLSGRGDGPTIGHVGTGAFCVWGFFAISGYLITRSRCNTSAREYGRHRFLRIMPGFWVCIAATALLFAPLIRWAEHGSIAGFDLGSALNYVAVNSGLVELQPSVNGVLTNAPNRALNGSLWTLMYEALCYLGITLLASAGLLQRRWPLLALFLLTALLLIGHAIPSSILYARFHLLVLTSGLDLALPFVAGALLYLYRDRVPDSRVLAAASFVVVLAASFAMHAPAPIVAAPYAYLVLWVGQHLGAERIARRNDISYGVYIYAYPVQQLLVAMGVDRHGLALLDAVTVLLVIGIAAASWFLVERPALRHKTSRRLQHVGADGGLVP